MSMKDSANLSSGTSVETQGVIHKSLTSALKFHQPLFPKKVLVEKVVEGSKDETVEKAKESDEASSKAPSSKDVDQAMQALKEHGYGDLTDDQLGCVRKALKGGAEIVTNKTGKLWIEREVPEEPPAFLCPKKLELGNKVQLLNWQPMGVHGATIDLFPQGSVTKMYMTKCLVSKNKMPYGVLPKGKGEFNEEERLMGVELDGKGPYAMKASDMMPYPYVTKDSTLIMRFPTMGTPSGETQHVEPMVM